MDDARGAYRERTARATLATRACPAGAPMALAKRSSNLFRDRAALPRQSLDLNDFCHVIEIDAASGWVDAEGLATYETMVDATLARGSMPAVVPQLKTITAGGAVAGVGIEATSFRHGLVHDTLLEADVLLSSGDVVTCRPDNEHRELFLALPNSYGTLGYALRLRLKTLPVKPFVAVEHLRFRSPEDFFSALTAACDEPATDFVDGVVFAADDLVLNVARFAATAPRTSDYGFEHIYHQSLRRLSLDWMRVRDWLWRWDSDWFWCSSHFGADRPWVRRLLGRDRLGSRTYTRWMRWNARWGLTRRLARLRGMRHVESVIQDVDLPAPQAPAFLGFLLRDVGILPIWVCPIRPAWPGRAFPLYPLAPGVRYINFGFWDAIERREPLPPWHFNRLIEHRLAALGGIKSLYSDSCFTREEFGAAYGLRAYAAAKQRYDPANRLPQLYDKCVRRA